MGFHTVNSVLAHSKAAGWARHVLIVIAQHVTDETGLTWVSPTTIARESRKSVRRIRYAISNLVQLGELVVVNKGGGRTEVDAISGKQGGKTTVYRIELTNSESNSATKGETNSESNSATKGETNSESNSAVFDTNSESNSAVFDTNSAASGTPSYIDHKERDQRESALSEHDQKLRLTAPLSGKKAATRQAEPAKLTAFQESYRYWLERDGDGGKAFRAPAAKRVRHQPGKRVSEVPFPDGFVLTAELRRYVKDGVDPELEFERFKAHALTHDRHCANWSQAFRLWCTPKADKTEAKSNTTIRRPEDYYGDD